MKPTKEQKKFFSNLIKSMMAEIGRKGGKTKSAAKSKAARVNGKKGGRPKKKVPNIG